MWGRVRSPINYVMLVHDAPQHQAHSVDNDFDYNFDNNTVSLVNATFDKWCQKNNVPLCNRYNNERAVEAIETLQSKRFPYLRYSMFDDEFHLYTGKAFGERSFEKSLETYKCFMAQWKGEIDPVGEIKLFDIPSFLFVPNTEQERFEKYVKEKGYLNRPITKAEKGDLLNFVTKKLRIRQKKDKTKPYVDLAKAIKDLGYKITECSKHKGTALYGFYNLERVDLPIAGEDWEDTI